MADDSSGTNSTLAFIVGGLVVAVGVLVYFLYSPDADSNDLNIKIDLPEVTAPAPKTGG
jgi:hypothetical protein